MKYLSKIAIIIFMSLTVISCNKDDETNSNSTVLGFNESVAMIQHGLNSINLKSSNKDVIIIEIKNFNSELELSTQYYIDAIQYTDDGNFNDEIAGDGLYTSIQEITISDNQKFAIQGINKINFSEDFKFNDELKTFLKGEYNSTTSKKGGKIKFGCKTRLARCPETSWWNSCWPLNSPCTRVEFYNCEASIEIEF